MSNAWTAGKGSLAHRTRLGLRLVSLSEIVGIVLLGALARSQSSWASEASTIKTDEVVLLYPTYARQSPDGRTWQVTLHGSVYEPEVNSLKRAALLGSVRLALGQRIGEAELEVFDARARLFLIDHERRKSVRVRIGAEEYPAGTSGPNGQFSNELRLRAAEIERWARDGWLDVAVVLSAGDERRFAGRVQLVKPRGLSVISDIDDTIKVSEVRNQKALLANSLLRPFRPVPGMAAQYQAMASQGAMFHYLSASPWQLYAPLADFADRAGFPPGTFHLKQVRLTDASILDLFAPQADYKERVLEELFAAFPGRRFVLIGDTGEEDPEIFGRAARRWRTQVAFILLRNTTHQRAGDPRYRSALEGVAPDRWKLFTDPGELASAWTRIAAEPPTAVNDGKR